jgi:hypothetical protein
MARRKRPARKTRPAPGRSRKRTAPARKARRPAPRRAATRAAAPRPARAASRPPAPAADSRLDELAETVGIMIPELSARIAALEHLLVEKRIARREELKQARAFVDLRGAP